MIRNAANTLSRHGAASVLAAAMLTTSSIAGCAASGAGGLPPAPRASDASDRALRDEAARESRLGPPAALSEAAETLLTLAGAPAQPLADDARRPLTDVITELPPLEREEPPRAISPEDREAALRLYAEGRVRLAEDDADGAAALLEQASKLDPGAMEVWRELGDAHSARGSRSSAERAYERAVALGLREPRPLTLLARASASRGDHGRAAALYAASLDVPDQPDAVRLASQAGLAAALEQTGDLLAATLVIEGALASLDDASMRRLTTSGNDQDLVRELARNRSQLRLAAGDARLRLGQPLLAAQHYASIPEGAPIRSDSVALRLAAANAASGRPASAALAVLDSISPDTIPSRDLRIALAALAKNSELRETMISAFVNRASSSGWAAHPSGRSVLARTEASMRRPADAVRTLERHLVSYPKDTEALRELLRPVPAERAGRALQTARGIVGSAPSHAGPIASELLAGTLPYRSIEDGLVGRNDADSLLLLAHVRGQIGWTAGAFDVIESAQSRSPDLARELDAARAAFGNQSGAFSASHDAARRIIDGIEADASAAGFLAASRAAGVLGEPELALEFAISASRADDATVDTHLALVPRAIALGDTQVAEEALARAVETDPYDERPYRGLASIFADNGLSPSPTALGGVLRSLRERRGDGQTASWLGVLERERQGLVASATREAERLASRMPPGEPLETDAASMLTRLWLASGDPADGLAFTQERLSIAPESTIWLQARTRVLVAGKEETEAGELLTRAIERRPDARLSRLIESLFRRELNDADRADTLALDRLAREGRTLATALEAAAVHVRRGEISEATARFEGELLPPGGMPSEQEMNSLSRLSDAVARRVLSRLQMLDDTLDDEQRARIAETITREATPAGELLRTLGGLGVAPSSGVLLAELRALAWSTPLDTDAALDAADRLANAEPDQAQGVYGQLVADLLAQDRAADAIDALLGVMERGTGPELAVALVQLVAGTGDASRFRGAIERVDATGATLRVLEVFGVDPQSIPDTPERRKAELAYLMSNVVASTGDQAAAELGYRLTLEWYPRHTWANNNLGYQLSVRGESLDEAEEMIAIALEQEPESPNILDSLGWVRYRLGVIDDERRADGTVVRRGALSLLGQAATLPGGRDNETVLDQYGDALWVGGDRQAAIESWQRARAAAAQAISSLRVADAPQERLNEMRARVFRINRKLNAATAGGEPPVTPTPALRADP
ncbi:MAG: tetratricopeptide repeat protein [Planctomycetota bacterium]